jgi:hypothetical protein
LLSEETSATINEARNNESMAPIGWPVAGCRETKTSQQRFQQNEQGIF